MSSRTIAVLVLLAAACSDEGPPKTVRDRSQPVPDTYLYGDFPGGRPGDGPASVDQRKTDGKLASKDVTSTPDTKPPVDKRPPDTKPPPDKTAPDLNCIPAGGDKCTQTPNNCCGGLYCCTCACGNFCKWSATISCQNVCINVC